MFNLRLCNAVIIRYSQLKFGHMYLCGMDYQYFSPHCCKCNSFGCTAAIRWGNACHGPHSDSLYSGSEHSQFNSPRLVKRETGFPNSRRALIGSNQLWRVNDSPYYREWPAVDCYNLWANKLCSGCSPSRENRYETGLLRQVDEQIICLVRVYKLVNRCACIRSRTYRCKTIRVGGYIADYQVSYSFFSKISEAGHDFE